MLVGRILFVLLAGAACAPLRHAHRANDSRAFCTAPPASSASAAVRWMVDSRPATDSARDPDRAARALAGTWDVLTVTTEGANPPETERWTLRLVPTTTDVWYQCAAGPCRTRRVAVIAAGAPVRPSIAFDSIAFANRRSTDGARVEARYDVHDNHLTLSGPPVMDAGAFYNLAEVSDSTMRGRWTDGSYVDAIIPRGNTIALEH